MRGHSNGSHGVDSCGGVAGCFRAMVPGWGGARTGEELPQRPGGEVVYLSERAKNSSPGSQTVSPEANVYHFTSRRQSPGAGQSPEEVLDLSQGPGGMQAGSPAPRGALQAPGSALRAGALHLPWECIAHPGDLPRSLLEQLLPLVRLHP